MRPRRPNEPLRTLKVEAAVTRLVAFRNAGGTVLLSCHRTNPMARIADATLELE